MLKLRLLRTKANNYSQLLDSANLPSIESLDELYIVANIAGKLLKPYAESLRDPNIVSLLLDQSIKDWKLTDWESVQLSLQLQGYQLLLTSESGEDLDFTAAQVKYIMLDESTKYLSAIPYATTMIVDRKEAMDTQKSVEIINSFIGEWDYFNKTKFVINPIQNELDALYESRKLLGIINPDAMFRLNQYLKRLHKTLLVISLS